MLNLFSLSTAAILKRPLGGILPYLKGTLHGNNSSQTTLYRFVVLILIQPIFLPYCTYGHAPKLRMADSSEFPIVRGYGQSGCGLFPGRWGGVKIGEGSHCSSIINFIQPIMGKKTILNFKGEGYTWLLFFIILDGLPTSNSHTYFCWIIAEMNTVHILEKKPRVLFHTEFMLLLATRPVDIIIMSSELIPILILSKAVWQDSLLQTNHYSI